MSLPATDRTEINGVPATVESLRTLALVNYGHFTSMQVEDGRVRGLDLHLQRLARSTEELFGQALDIEQTQCWMRQAAGGDARKLTLRVNVFSRALNRDRLLEPVRPDVLVTTSAARNLAPTPLRVGSVDYQREQPHIKHVATFGLFQQRRTAQARGFDDALFVDAFGAVAEGSIWNVGFLDESGVVWPDAPALAGVSMQLLQRGLRERGIPSSTRYVDLDEIGRFRGAFFTNSSCAVMPIAGIDAIEFKVDPGALAMLEACYASNPAEAL